MHIKPIYEVRFLVVYMNNGGPNESAHLHSIARAFAARSEKMGGGVDKGTNFRLHLLVSQDSFAYMVKVQ